MLTCIVDDSGSDVVAAVLIATVVVSIAVVVVCIACVVAVVVLGKRSGHRW